MANAKTNCKSQRVNNTKGNETKAKIRYTKKWRDRKIFVKSGVSG